MSDPRNLGPEVRENKGTTGMNSKSMEKAMGMETAQQSTWRLMMIPMTKQGIALILGCLEFPALKQLLGAGRRGRTSVSADPAPFPSLS